MNYLENLQYFMQFHCGITHAKDIVEIIFFIIIIRAFLYLLDLDSNKKSLYFAHFFLLLFIGCIWFKLSTITFFLVLYLPALIMIFILCHQETLQRNIITLMTPKPLLDNNFEWVDKLIKACLHAQARQKPILCIIENTQRLNHLIKTEYLLEAPVSTELMNLISESFFYENDKFFWIQTSGILKACNSQPVLNIHSDWLSQELSENPHLACLIALTKKTDAIALISKPREQGLTIIAQGILADKIVSTRIAFVIKSYIKKNRKNNKDGEASWHEFIDKKQESHQNSLV